MRSIRSLCLCGVSALAFLLPPAAHALSNYTAQDLSNFSQPMVNGLVKTVAAGMDHRAYMPASSMGWLLGIDMGVEITAIELPSDFKSALASASQVNLNSVPTLVPLPRLNLHKGLPFGLDLGLSYIGYQDKARIIGGDLQWTFSDFMKFLPVDAALRLNYTSEKLWYIKGSMWQTDLLVSKNLLVLEPYVGMGMQFWSGSLDVPTNLPAGQGLPSSISGSASGTNVHFFAGVPIKLMVFHLTPEIDYSTSKVTSFGAKFSFNL